MWTGMSAVRGYSQQSHRGGTYGRKYQAHQRSYHKTMCQRMLDTELQDSVFPMQGFGFALDWYFLASHLFPLMEWKCFLCDSVCSEGIYGFVCVFKFTKPQGKWLPGISEGRQINIGLVKPVRALRDRLNGFCILRLTGAFWGPGVKFYGLR